VRTETATEVRKNLSLVLRDLFDTKEDVGIELSGQVVAILTLNEPRRSVQPIRVKSEDAKKGWAELLQAVSMRRARFYFARKSNEQTYRIYLVPNPGFENSFAKRWAEHLEEHKTKNADGQVSSRDLLEAQNDTKHQIASLRDEFAKLDKKIALAFALSNRGGDVFKTPEQGIVRRADEDDLDQYEVD
jgi:hypothetical protein